jgi:hypothetical protein
MDESCGMSNYIKTLNIMNPIFYFLLIKSWVEMSIFDQKWRKTRLFQNFGLRSVSTVLIIKRKKLRNIRITFLVQFDSTQYYVSKLALKQLKDDFEEKVEQNHKQVWKVIQKSNLATIWQ